MRSVAFNYSSAITKQLVAALILVFGTSAVFAQNVEPIDCDGHVLRGAYEDVSIAGTTCTLDGATIYGSVFVHGGTLYTTANGATILGGVHLIYADDVTLTAVRVRDEVTLEHSGDLILTGDSSVAVIAIKESGNLTIDAGASAGEVLLEHSGNVAITGTVAGIHSKGSGGVRLTNATVFPGGVTMALASGALEICGSTIGGIDGVYKDGSGGVNVLESSDVLVVAEGSCGTSQIEGAVIVKKGVGQLRLVGAALHSDLIVAEHVGDVEIDGSGCDDAIARCGAVSDVNVEKVTGDVTLRSLTTDSDTTVVSTEGRVTITGSTLGSDVRLRLNNAVTVAHNSFALEDVLIAKNKGPVLFDRNCDGRLTITENENVFITNNNANDAAAVGADCQSGFGFSDTDVSKNLGSVLISNNTGEGLYCADNDSVPSGAGNSITFSDGQCAGF